MNLQQIASVKNPELIIPTFRGELRPFQKNAVMAIYSHPRILLAEKTGWGKTVESIAAATFLSDQDLLPPNTCLVVVLNSKREDWKSEFEKFSPLKTIIGYTKDRDCKYLKRRFNVLIISFSTLLARIDQLEKIPWGTIFIDEAAALKNHEAKAYAATMRLTNKAHRVVLLNATSLENHPGDVFSQINLLEPGFFGTYQNFVDTYCRTEVKFIKTVYGTIKRIETVRGIKSPEALQQLKEKISKFYYQSIGVEAQMPLSVVKHVPVELKDCQVKEYKDQVALYRSKKIKGSSLLFNLRKICDGKLRDWANEKDPIKTSAKLEALVDLVNTFDEPFVVYSTYIDQILAIAKTLKDMGKRVGFYTGINMETREQHVEAFDAGEKDCLILSVSGARGKNFQTARYLIEFNSVYNPELEHQIRSRINRLTSAYKTVFIYKLVAQNTVEDRILNLLRAKGTLSTFVNNEGTDFKDLTEEQISLLLNDRESLINRDRLEEDLCEEVSQEKLPV